MAVIGTIRNKLGGLLILVIAFAMLAFILMDFGGKGNGPVRGSSIANVDGQEVSYAEFDSRLEANESYMRNQLNGQALTESQKENIRTSTFNEIINEKLTANLYDELGLSLGVAEKKALLFDKDFQHPSITSSFTGQDGQYSAANFKQYLETLNVPDANSGLSPEEKRAQWTNFEKAIYKERADKKYNTLIAKSTNIPTWMAQTLYNYDNTTANAEYVYLPFSSIENSAISYTDADLQSYLSKHAAEYKQDESASIKYVTFPIVPSTDDINAVDSWINDKFASWKEAENDSFFVMANSETRWDDVYNLRGSVVNPFADSMFVAPVGSYFGPVLNEGVYSAYKLIDRKQIPDSVKVRHLLVTGEGYETQEEVNAVLETLETQILEEGVSIASLTAQYSQDPSNASNGGDLGWARPGEMVVPFNNAIFYQMEPGDVKKVFTQFGVHFIEVYAWGTTSTGVKIATLDKTIFPSEETTNGIFAEASLYSGNNRTKEAFLAGSDNVQDASNLSKKANIVSGLPGSARELVKWAFNAETGEVSEPFMIDDNFVVALQDGKYEKGPANLANVKALVEAELIKEKKAELLKAKVSGSDLNAIASSNSVSVQSASSLSMNNVTLAGIGNEPKVAGAAIGLAENSVSGPIIGENGVFVVKTTSKTAAPAATDLSSYKSNAGSYASTIQSKLFDALKDASKIEDNSFDFF